MNLDKIAAHLRLKTPFEAVDLGFLLAQRFARPLWTAWITLLSPIFLIIIAIASFTNAFWIPLLIVWWLKPLFARIPVIVLSRAFFGHVPELAQTMQAFSKAARKPSTIWQTTLGRFSPYRAFNMFINDLEGGTSKQRRQRAKSLRNPGIDTAVYSLYFITLLCEIVLFSAIIAFFALIQPPNIEFSFLESFGHLFKNDNPQPIFQIFLLLSYAATISFTEPLLAAGSFGLYISRRVELEGWDIQLTFRKLANRIQSKSTITPLIIATILTALVAIAPNPAVAQEITPQEITEPAPITPTKALITEILEQPEFGQPITQKSWKLRDKFNKDKDKKDKKKFTLPFGQILTILAWSAAALLVVGILYLIVRHVSPPTISKSPPTDEDWQQIFESHADAPQIAQNLPEDIIAHARQARATGDETRALTLLYAGMLRALKRDFALELAPGLTAYETTRHVQKQNGPHEIVAEIANAWTARVFAHKTLDDARFETIILRWQTTFSPKTSPQNSRSTP